MDAPALVMWSMALGAVAGLTAARAAQWLARPDLARLRAVSYHASVFLLVLVLSGVLPRLNPLPPERLQPLQVLAGPLCVGLSALWIHGWLGAAQRDRTMAVLLRGAALLLPLTGALALALPPPQQLPAAAAASLLGSALALWLTVRAWLMGDRMALAMALGCGLTLPAIAGLYAMAMELLPLEPWAQALLALCAAASNGVTGLVLWRRDRHAGKARRLDAMCGAVDPLTQLPNGPALVHGLVQALRRRRRTGRHGAVLAVLVFAPERLAAQAGANGLQEAWIALAGRMRRELGVVNPVGRYWDRCFVGLVETIPSPAWLRTLGLRVATSLRRPIEVTGPDGRRVRLQADIGVGVVHLPPHAAEPEDVLDLAQRMAAAARAMASRTAMRDPVSGAIVPVEQAALGAARAAAAAGPALGSGAR